jgi:hypothetical protein
VRGLADKPVLMTVFRLQRADEIVDS